MTLFRLLLVIALLLTPAALDAYKARFFVLISCDSLRGDGLVHLKDRATGVTYRLTVSCPSIAPTMPRFL